MAKGRTSGAGKKPIEQYTHDDKKRVNNPPVGLVTPDTDKDGGKKKYQYDPHLDPQLQWAGKAEHTSFEVPTVSLHVHERIDPRSIIETVKKTDGAAHQISLFETEKMPLREAIEFYKHSNNWSNRLIAGDSLLVMNSLIEKEGMGGKVQMVYFDPPYGITYKSNFQPFVNKRDVKDGKDEDLTTEPEMIKAFRDTWELGIHSYLTYLRDRLKLAYSLLSETGSVFVQISDENIHHVRELMDEIFGSENFVSLITFKKTAGLGAAGLPAVSDYNLWYARDKGKIKFHQLYHEKELEDDSAYVNLEIEGKRRKMNDEEKKDFSAIPKNAKIFRYQILLSSGRTESCIFPIEFKGETFNPTAGRSWATNPSGIENLIKSKRIEKTGTTLSYVRFANDFPVNPISNFWADTASGSGMGKIYVVQTNSKVIERCMLMCTDPGDLVLDITCGSGTTAHVAEQWGRRWITCDTSRVALALAKQRFLTTNYDYYELAHPHEGVGSGFSYKTVPHITLKSIANNEPPSKETLFDQPLVDGKRTRVTGPFTVEAVPAPIAKSLEEIERDNDPIEEADNSISRRGETLRQSEWRDELLKSGVRGKGGNYIKFSRVEPVSGTKFINAEAETKVEVGNKDLFKKKDPSLNDQPKKVLICFGPEFAPLEQRTVELAIEEAVSMKPKPDIILFVANQFDSEAGKDIDETNWPGVTLLRVQMNADLFTDDLKKKRTGNDSFWLIGQPDILMTEIKKGDDKGKWEVEVKGFDYYDPKTGNVVSGGSGNIAMWMLDTDYDGRSIFPTQIFFPMAGANEGWAKLAKNLKAEIDEEKIEAFKGTKSLPFTPGKLVAIKIIDDRGIESLRILNKW
jgi:adenine-specific DNA-methyltransferase